MYLLEYSESVSRNLSLIIYFRHCECEVPFQRGGRVKKIVSLIFQHSDIPKCIYEYNPLYFFVLNVISMCPCKYTYAEFKDRQQSIWAGFVFL